MLSLDDWMHVQFSIDHTFPSTCLVMEQSLTLFDLMPHTWQLCRILESNCLKSINSSACHYLDWLLNYLWTIGFMFSLNRSYFTINLSRFGAVIDSFRFHAIALHISIMLGMISYRKGLHKVTRRLNLLSLTLRWAEYISRTNLSLLEQAVTVTKSILPDIWKQIDSIWKI